MDNPCRARDAFWTYDDIENSATVGKLTGRDREIAKDFLKMLADKNQAKRKD